MRVNVYAEELPVPGEVAIIEKKINGQTFTGLRIPLYLPVTLPDGSNVRGKFMHHEDDDDSSAITIWGKKDLRVLLREALELLDKHYGGCLSNVSAADLKISARNENGVLYALKYHPLIITNDLNSKSWLREIIEALEDKGLIKRTPESYPWCRWDLTVKGLRETITEG